MIWYERMIDIQDQSKDLSKYPEVKTMILRVRTRKKIELLNHDDIKLLLFNKSIF